MTAVASVAEIADRVARDYLGLRPGERFAIVVDDRTDAEIPDELARAALTLGADPVEAEEVRRRYHLVDRGAVEAGS